MINFKKLCQEIQDYDRARELLIKKSRDVLKLSKQVIYAVHRDELNSVAKIITEMEKEKKALEQIAQHDPEMKSEGSYKLALQEYAEALLYYQFMKTGELKELNVGVDSFLLGLSDLTGELVRKAVFLAGKGETIKVVEIKEEVDKIYGELLKFDFRENEIRRKVDAVKYNLLKLEDLVLQLKLKGRLLEKEE